MNPVIPQRYPVLKSADRGFTLLEVLVAMVLLSVALAAIFELFSANLKVIAKTDDITNAVIMAESKMRDILAEETLAERSSTEAAGNGYRIDTVVISTANERTQNLQVKLYEINLTVFWTKDSKERTFHLKSMKMVNKQI